MPIRGNETQKTSQFKERMSRTSIIMGLGALAIVGGGLELAQRSPAPRPSQQTSEFTSALEAYSYPTGEDVEQQKMEIRKSSKEAKLIAWSAAIDQARAEATAASAQAAASATPTPASTTITSSSHYAAWTKVAVCEEGGWVGSAGYNYPDSLGINRTNWFHYGGGSDVSPAAQIAVADRMVADLGISIPDQNGCQPGGW